MNFLMCTVPTGSSLKMVLKFKADVSGVEYFSLYRIEQEVAEIVGRIFF